jgi:GT2 family glycosyltransferase
VTVAASIVVVTHRGADDMVRACLTSIADAAGPAVSTIVVDNSDGPAVAGAAYGPGVDEVVRVENRGFGAAANAGIRLARRGSSAPVAVLNDDIEVSDGWLAPLVRALSEDLVGAVQPALLRFGTDRINSLGVHLDRFAAGSDVGLDTPVAQLDGCVPIDIFTAGAVLFRPEFLDQTGGFDERYFLYYEDVDLALRGAELGWAYRCEQRSTVRHHGSATTADLGDELVRYRERNRLWTAVRFAPPPTVARAFWLSARRLRHAPQAAHARALAGGLAGAPGALARRFTAGRRGRGAIVSADGG